MWNAIIGWTMVSIAALVLLYAVTEKLRFRILKRLLKPAIAEILSGNKLEHATMKVNTARAFARITALETEIETLKGATGLKERRETDRRKKDE